MGKPDVFDMIKVDMRDGVKLFIPNLVKGLPCQTIVVPDGFVVKEIWDRVRRLRDRALKRTL